MPPPRAWMTCIEIIKPRPLVAVLDFRYEFDNLSNPGGRAIFPPGFFYDLTPHTRPPGPSARTLHQYFLIALAITMFIVLPIWSIIALWQYSRLTPQEKSKRREAQRDQKLVVVSMQCRDDDESAA